MDTHGTTRDLASRRLLFVDDDPDLRELVSRYLRPRGYDVTVAEEAEEAAALLEFRSFDFLCADLSLDGLERLEGLDLIDEAHRRAPTMRILVQTGTDDAVVHAVCRARGADAVLVKRGSIERLAVALGDLARGGARCEAV